MGTSASLYIGLISGTSVDGVDAALVEFTQSEIQLTKARNFSIPSDLRQQLLAFNTQQPNELDSYARCDVLLGRLFADCVTHLLDETPYSPADILAIGSHGQTIRHYPEGDTPSTLQIGDPNIIAEQTGITTVADFRRRDMAAGGQGAPLVPAFHNEVFRSSLEDRAVLNLGGIANLTLLPADPQQAVLGFDTGPANCLLDDWIKQCQQLEYDKLGQWSAAGTANQQLVAHMLSDPYFALAAPKSTGRDYFQLSWLTSYLTKLPEVSDCDVQASLAELTVQSIANALHETAPKTNRLLVCGGGVHNQNLLERLQQQMPDITIESTANYGVDPDFVEAMAFAWLAKHTMEHKSGSLCSVTGARHNRILGGIYQA